MPFFIIKLRTLISLISSQSAHSFYFSNIKPRRRGAPVAPCWHEWREFRRRDHDAAVVTARASRAVRRAPAGAEPLGCACPLLDHSVAVLGVWPLWRVCGCGLYQWTMRSLCSALSRLTVSFLVLQYIHDS